VFSFELSTQLINAISAYHSGEMVRASEFAHTVKMLKSRAFAMKRERDINLPGAVIYGA
jgi:hypothetical protein